MPYTRSIDPDGFLLTKISGTATFQEFCKLQEELGGYMREGDVYELVLHADDMEGITDNAEIRSSAYNMSVLKGPGKAFIAFVCTTNFSFGICRQLVLQIENEFTCARVFRTEDPARKWLHEMRIVNASDTKPAQFI